MITDDQGRTHYVRGRPVKVNPNGLREAWIESGVKAIKAHVETSERSTAHHD